MENKKKIASIVMAAMVMTALAAFSMPVSAQGDPGSGCVAETDFYGNISGGVYFEQQGWALFSKMEKTFDVPTENIKLARVYTGFWQGSPGKGGYFNITIDNATGGSNTTETYKACDPCPQASGCAPWQPGRCDMLNNATNMPWNENLDLVNMYGRTVGCGVQFISYNATPYITPGSNTITVRTEPCADCPRGGWDGRIYLIALLVVYENETMPEITYWINEGALYLEKGSDCDGPDNHLYASKYFDGTNVSNPTRVKLWSLGWPHVINATTAITPPPSGEANTTLNGNNIGIPDITESHGGGYNEVLLRWNDISTSFLSPPSNFLEYYDNAPLYERAFAEVFIVQGDVGPDLEVTNIEFPAMIRPGRNYQINATVANYGSASTGVPFNVSLEIDGIRHDKKTVSALAASGTTVVNFKPVENPAYGCYNFTVVADCDNDVSEGNEYNNEKTEKRQVGYCIVVKSNSDFEKLNVSGSAPLPAGCFENKSGTYYIQNMNNHPIENRAGRGIDIQNTNVHFVITNCTIRDCLECGVFFHSVTNGTVNDSVVRDNTMKGIKMQNTSNVTIDNNYVHDNLKYGIDVYMAVMPYLDSHHITITNNELTRNLYGIELMGDDCTVRDNVILNTTAYGGGESGWGIYVAGIHNTIYNNTIKYSHSYAMYVDYDRNCLQTYENCIFGNTFVDNLRGISHPSQVYDSSSNHVGCMNYWNNTVELGYYYGGTGPGNAYDNRTGNNWSDYNGGDSDGDGIGDTPYGIDGGTAADYYPLMQPWTDYERVDCGDVNCDDGLTSSDAAKIRYHASHPEYPLDSMWAADVNCDGGITSSDAAKVRYHASHPEYQLDCCAGCA